MHLYQFAIYEWGTAVDFEQANNEYISTKNEGQNGDWGTLWVFLVVITVLFAMQSVILTEASNQSPLG